MTSVHGISVAGGTFPAIIWRLFMSEAIGDTPYVDFDVTVTVRDFTPGDYVARLTVRDQIGRDIRSQDVPFSLP